MRPLLKRGRPKKTALTKKENPSTENQGEGSPGRPGSDLRPRGRRIQVDEQNMNMRTSPTVEMTKRRPGCPKKKTSQVEDENSVINKAIASAKRGPGGNTKSTLQELYNHQVYLNVRPNSRSNTQSKSEPEDTAIFHNVKTDHAQMNALESKNALCSNGLIEDAPQIPPLENDEASPPPVTPEFHPCPYCDTSFTDTNFLQRHVKYHHAEEYTKAVRRQSARIRSMSSVYPCPHCSHTFQSPGQMTLHRNQAHPVVPPQKLHTCPVCPRSFDYLRNLRNHCQLMHKMPVHMHNGHLRCSDCRRSFRKSWGQGPHQCVGRKTKTLFAHPEYTQPTSLVVGVNCDKCSATLKSATSLRNHMLRHTGEKPSACLECGKTFANSSLVFKHMKMHTGVVPFECEVCPKKFAERSVLRRHMVTHTGDKPYSCSECGKTFAYLQSVKNHKLTHSQDEKSFACAECGKSFHTAGNLRDHRKIHNKVFQCSECGLKVSKYQVLKVHMRKHTGERPYHCTVCDNRFKRLHHLHNHQRTHTGERPYECDWCGAAFTQSGDLAKHKRIHTGQKPYTCDVCNRRFRCKGSLDTHSASHSDARPFECEVCQKAFRLQLQLRRHKKIHLDERLYPCLHCDGRFRRNEHLKIHIRRLHSQEAS